MSNELALFGVVEEAEVEVLPVEVLAPADSRSLFGLGTRVARPWLTVMDLRREWAAAWEAWLGDLGSDRTREAYRAAWEDLLLFLDGPDFWRITHDNIRAWRADMEQRPLAPRMQASLARRGKARERGYSASTINQYMAAISSFFSYTTERWPVTFPDGTAVALAQLDERGVRAGAFVNPVRVVGRKKGRGYQAYYMGLEQLQKFLKAIDPTTLFGVRDYAMFLLYISTGMRNSEIRLLRWEDFEERAGVMWFFWRGKGSGSKENKSGWHEMPRKAWFAVQQYLKLAGRWGHLEGESFIFTAVTDRAKNLSNVGEAWSRTGQALSLGEVNRLARRYCERANRFFDAGIQVERVHVHTLRHSFAMYLKAKNVSVDDICDALHHESLATTKLYLQQMEGTRAKFAAMMEDDLGV
ncbi:MAG: site-specific integrase [Anaerolineae bacterium]|nr:site-specific integrase [Anaerolineae bacterium]